MMIIPTLFALICGTAGWYYLLHAGGAAKFEEFERPADNRLRVRLRRWGGAGMVLLALAFYIALRIANMPHGSPVSIAICLSAVIILLPIILFLAYVDIRLTRKMRDAHRSRKK